ncbi:MAG TPA: hypothetical protein DDZ51_18620 [Planctomycetaceae bacterium]|nr:hypothetical protein [Planctomycetaceae bacterium]
MDGRSLRDFSPSLSDCERSILWIAFGGTDSQPIPCELGLQFLATQVEGDKVLGKKIGYCFELNV